MKRYLYLFLRVSKKPPRVIIRRCLDIGKSQIERFVAPLRVKKLNEAELLKQFCQPDINGVWEMVRGRNFPFPTGDVSVEITTDQKVQILQKAKAALENRVSLLGMVNICLGHDINWNKDYKTGKIWPNKYSKDIEYNNEGQPSDVKIPWEISRLQWLIPLGQGFVLTLDEQYARKARDTVAHWIQKNPYAGSVNWSCTMEPAMRIFTFMWLLAIFGGSKSWQKQNFRFEFLKTLLLHADYVDRHFEISDLNGNHCTADAAALYTASLLLRDHGSAKRWQTRAWDILTVELPRQVGVDGVDFEGSIPYHRLVTELFVFPALYREAVGHHVPNWYKERCLAMADFINSYMRSNGTSPLLGDADDARLLPLGNQGIGDHAYLADLIYSCWAIGFQSKDGPVNSEMLWLLDSHQRKKFRKIVHKNMSADNVSRQFCESGYYVFRSNDNHLFVDCAPVGLAGKGGHGHNDCLGFELSLCGENIIIDSGAYAYTGSYGDRNLFRSTEYHSTPQIERNEINRFIDPSLIWMINYDAVPHVHRCCINSDVDTLEAGHSGYHYLEQHLMVSRSFHFHHAKAKVEIIDQIKMQTARNVSIPFHLSPEISTEVIDDKNVIMSGRYQKFKLTTNNTGDWRIQLDDGFVSMSYGVKQPRRVIRFCCEGQRNVKLETTIMAI